MIKANNTCSNCGYYRQHYIWRQEYKLINSGHCVHPPKNRRCKANMKACSKWITQTEEYHKNYNQNYSP